MNPIALVLIVLGVLLFGTGCVLLVRGRRTAGLTTAVLGFCMLLSPLIVSYSLFR